MKHIVVAAMLLLAAANCHAQTPPAQRVKNTILVLAPQGVDPARDTIGYNALVARVTQAFSLDLEDQLKTKGKKSIFVLDQSPALDRGQKFALYAGRSEAEAAIIVSMEHERIGNDDRLSLMVQYLEYDFSYENGKMAGVLPTRTLNRNYWLRSTRDGDNPQTMTDLAKDFVGYLQREGRLSN